MIKLQLTLADQEAALLSNYGSQLGYSLQKIVKFFISQASEEILRRGMVQTYQMSEKTEAAGLEALAEHQLGKTKPIVRLKEYLEKV